MFVNLGFIIDFVLFNLTHKKNNKKKTYVARGNKIRKSHIAKKQNETQTQTENGTKKSKKKN